MVLSEWPFVVAPPRCGGDDRGLPLSGLLFGVPAAVTAAAFTSGDLLLRGGGHAWNE